MSNPGKVIAVIDQNPAVKEVIDQFTANEMTALEARAVFLKRQLDALERDKGLAFKTFTCRVVDILKDQNILPPDFVDLK